MIMTPKTLKPSRMILWTAGENHGFNQHINNQSGGFPSWSLRRKKVFSFEENSTNTVWGLLLPANSISYVEFISLAVCYSLHCCKVAYCTGTTSPATSFWWIQFKVKARIDFEKVKRLPWRISNNSWYLTHPLHPSSWPHQQSDSAGEWVPCTVSCSPNATYSGVFMLPRPLKVRVCQLDSHSRAPTLYQSAHAVFLPMTLTCEEAAGWIEAE